MAEQSYPFDAAGAGGTGGQSSVLEAEWQRMGRSWLTSGAIADHTDSGGLLAVTGSGAAMTVSLATGVAWVEGFFYRNDAAATLTIGTADATNPRIDTVILRMDRAANNTRAFVKAGTPAASPVAPTLTQTDTLWEFPLADVRVDAAVGTIAANKVTDRRRIVSKPVTLAGGDTITARAATVVPLVVKGAASQTGNLFEARDTAGTLLSRVDSVGSIIAPYLVAGGLGGSGILRAEGVAAGQTVVTVRGAASQTAPLQEWQNSAGTIVASVSASGTIANQGWSVNGADGKMTFGNNALNYGVAGALAGYHLVNIAGTDRKIPYYAV